MTKEEVKSEISRIISDEIRDSIDKCRKTESVKIADELRIRVYTLVEVLDIIKEV